MATDLTALTARILLSIQVDSQKALNLSTPDDAVTFGKAISLAFGTGASQANQVYASGLRQLGGGASETLDIYGGLTNAFGGTINLTSVLALAIVNRSDELTVPTAAVIVVGNAASYPWVGPFGAGTHTVAVRPGGMLLFVAKDATGWAVTSGTADLLKIAGDAVLASQYDIVIIGRSA